MKENILAQIIAKEISENGPMPFSRYMELCLYHPEYGYYRQKKPPIGKTGDYYTTPCVHKIFGHVLAKSFVEILQLLDDYQFTLVEAGAGNGYLIRDIGEYLSLNYPHLLEKITLIIIEPHIPYRNLQKVEAERFFKNFLFIETPEELPDFTGIFYSNELFDSMPVEIIETDPTGKLKQVFIIFENNLFSEILLPIDKKIEEFMISYNIKIPNNFRTELSLYASDFYKTISKKIIRGAILTIDYGYPRNELFQISHNRGTLMCYYRHTALENPYIRQGLQDITYHIDFTLLKDIGEKAGLITTGFVEQYYFLMGSGILEEVEKLKNDNEELYNNEINKIKTILLPSGMGETFKTLLQIKGINYIPNGFAYRNRVNLL